MATQNNDAGIACRVLTVVTIKFEMFFAFKKNS